MNTELASIPFLEVNETLLVKITGPVNSDVDFPSDPPSTRRELVRTPSVALTKLIDLFFEISSPVTVLIGLSKISSCPVTLLSFLLPEYEIPLSFIPVKKLTPPDSLIDCANNSSVALIPLSCLSGNAVE